MYAHSPMLLLLLAEVRQQALLEEAKMARLRRQVGGRRSIPLARVADAIGDILIDLGQWLKRRHQPAMS